MRTFALAAARAKSHACAHARVRAHITRGDAQEDLERLVDAVGARLCERKVVYASVDAVTQQMPVVVADISMKSHFPVLPKCSNIERQHMLKIAIQVSFARCAPMCKVVACISDST